MLVFPPAPPPAPDPRDERRLRVLRLTPELLVNLLSGRGEYTVDGIPADVKVHRTAYRIDFDEVLLMLASKEFDPVPDGHNVPDLNPTIRRLEPDFVVGP